jgi:hypothetical protein
MNLQTFKGKQVAAKKGWDLLKSKADALKVIAYFFFLMKGHLLSVELRNHAWLLFPCFYRLDSERSVRLFTLPKLGCPTSPLPHFSV